MKNIVGIDFGHGETSAGFLNSDNVIGNEVQMSDLNIVGEEKVIPSVVCIMPSDEVVISPSANQIAKAKEFGISFKDPLIGSEKYSKISDSNLRFFEMFLSKTYEAIKGNSNNPLLVSQDGETDFLVYIACPSGWNDEQIEAYKEFTNSTCNIPVVDIVKESRAAYIAARRAVIGGIRTQGGNVLVIDYGSSTIDFTYFNNESRFEPVHEGYKLGARIIEETFLEYLKKHESEAYENISLVEENCGSIKGNNVLLYVIRKLKEEYFSSPNQERFELSIDLSRILLDKSLRGRYIEPSSGEGYSKQEVLEILSVYINDLANMLDVFLTKEGVSSIDKVILTGGASRMFFFKELVSQKYNVSKDNGTLIVDLNPSLTISRGIAAFGYMNEKNNLVDPPLWESVEEWIRNQLPQLLKATIEKCIGDMYYSEFSNITSRYEDGYIIKDSKHNLDGLEDELINLLNRWSASGDVMAEKINLAIQNSMISSIKEKLSAFAKTWGLDVVDSDFSFNIELDISASLTPDSCQSLIHYVWEEAKKFINDRDFWPWDDSTSPYRDRDLGNRKSIVRNMNTNLRTYFNGLDYISPLDDTISDIATMVRAKVRDFVDNAKLQQYR